MSTSPIPDLPSPERVHSCRLLPCGVPSRVTSPLRPPPSCLPLITTPLYLLFRHTCPGERRVLGSEFPPWTVSGKEEGEREGGEGGDEWGRARYGGREVGGRVGSV